MTTITKNNLVQQSFHQIGSSNQTKKIQLASISDMAKNVNKLFFLSMILITADQTPKTSALLETAVVIAGCIQLIATTGLISGAAYFFFISHENSNPRPAMSDSSHSGRQLDGSTGYDGHQGVVFDSIPDIVDSIPHTNFSPLTISESSNSCRELDGITGYDGHQGFKEEENPFSSISTVSRTTFQPNIQPETSTVSSSKKYSSRVGYDGHSDYEYE